jgi:chitinase
MGTWEYATFAFCCDPKAFGRETVNLPVPLANLFPQVGPESNVEKLDITIDRTMGGAGNDIDPNDNKFGFYILSGPEDEITTFDKRDGSHWELSTATIL